MIKKVLIIITLVLAVTGSVFSQSSSGYTRIGLGDPVYTYSGRRLAMGQLGTSVADIDYIGSLNPAGWYRLSRTRIEFGLTYNGLIIKDAKSSYYTGEADFTGFTIGFPVSPDYGIGAVIGLLPYSDVSYKVRKQYTAAINYDIEYEGRGGLSKVFAGTSYTLPFGLAVGATFDYYFGNLTYYSRVNFEGENNFDSEYKRNYAPYGLGTTFGLISPDLSNLLGSASIQDLRVGFAGNYIGEVKADTTLESSSTLYSDTLGMGGVTMNIPLRFSVGLSFVLSKYYLISLDFLSQAWSDYKLNGLKDANLQNGSKVSAGFEYKSEHRIGESFWDQIMFRAGLSYEQLPYRINGTSINEYAVSGGFSIPVTYENTLDIGLQYAFRGTTENNLIKENRIRLSLGISLGDLWFVRQER